MKLPFLAGIVEGFYGREWPWAARLAYAEVLAGMGLNSYLYCPKSDAALRREWRAPWPAERAAALRGLGERYRARGVLWGVGLSPLSLCRDGRYGEPERAALRAKIREINELGPDLQAILFDDMRGDTPGLAERQAAIIADAREWSSAAHLLACPTYYSFDPQLQRLFGPMPPDYWEGISAAWPPDCHIFWTGNEVCAPAIARQDLRAIRERLSRKPCLWDNYPVNDGERNSRRLFLPPLPKRERGLEAELSGHFCNPMNQACLSLYPLGGLAALYGGDADALEECFGAPLAKLLTRDGERFREPGLDGFTPEECAALAAEYAAVPAAGSTEMGIGAAAEVAAWLRGEYRFDPACLTD